MKISFRAAFGIALVLASVSTLSAQVVFTTNKTIGITDTAFEGADIVISNCTLTVDGPHAFSSLAILNGGKLTHTFLPGGDFADTVPTGTTGPVVLTSTNPAPFADTNLLIDSVLVRDEANTITYSNFWDYVVQLGANELYEIRRLEGSTIPDGATITVSFQSLLPPTQTGLNLSISNNLVVEPGGMIDAAGRGYGSSIIGRGNSGGSPFTGAGGGNGGIGGMASSGATGGSLLRSPIVPETKGGAGGNGTGGSGGNGGGSVALIVGGTAQLNGMITVNGNNATNSRSGGGAGGSVRIQASIISGSGLILADGGNGEPVHGGGGGGGRIALSSVTNHFTGTLLARGGLGWRNGGAGTIYLASASERSLLVNNGGRIGTNTPLLQITSSPDLLIASNAIVTFSGNPTLRNLWVMPSGRIVTPPQLALAITVYSNAVIDAGAKIDADRLGFLPGMGQGAGMIRQTNSGSGTVYFGGGAGHGGYGGSPTNVAFSGGNAYGNELAPNLIGSGGGGWTNSGGYGGGAIRLNVGNELLLNGVISASAGHGILAYNAGGGGGSGGSVWLTSKRFSGTGGIEAVGGNGATPFGGGGSGGRIAIGFTTNEFTGTINARGGDGNGPGAAGTILLDGPGSSDSIVMDNGSLIGTNTPFSSSAGTSVTIRGGAKGITGSFGLAASNLFVGSGSEFVLGSQQGSSANINLTISGSLLIEQGGRITASGKGYPAGQGPRAGVTMMSGTNCFAGGGGNAGYGGSAEGTAYGGGPESSGTILLPGSGGGSCRQSGGSAGGGAVRITVGKGPLIVDGELTADGTAPIGNSGGGGAGGNISISTPLLLGSGRISANGGNGAPGRGGGGSGGVIGIGASSNAFTGQITAYGGSGVQNGAAGRIGWGLPQSLVPTRVLIDNGGLAGTNTVFFAGTQTDVVIRGGARGMLFGGSTIKELVIETNSFLMVEVVSFGNILQIANATVAAGAGIVGDAVSSSTTSAGQYSQFPTAAGGGASHAGLGGAGDNSGALPGPVSYGSFSNPNTSGSIGRASISVGITSSNALGGGIVRLTVSGALKLDGRISANGGNAIFPNAGGASGGSVMLNVAQLSGSGSISADGGDGWLPRGGGGGGGRVHVNYTAPQTNAFTGIITARGGNGFTAGGAGTLYLQRPNQSPELRLDNGGLKGGWTSLSSTVGTPPLNLVIQAGADTSLSGTWNSVTIRSNSLASVFPGAGAPTSVVVIQSNLVIEPTAVMHANAITPTGQGIGRTSANARVSGGGGHGGAGGAGNAANSEGGRAYGSALLPNSSGSPGGSYTSLVPAGLGGGVLNVTVNGTASVDGSISANGGHASTNGVGGGSGGTVVFSAARLLGSGAISANGGNGSSTSGGGGGGRIALRLGTNFFTGAVEAHGGLGFRNGGAGTVLISDRQGGNPRLLIDNFDIVGTNTPLSETAAMPITVARGAVLETSGAVNATSLTIKSNATLRTQSFTPLTAANLEIEAGGALNADGAGSGPGQGQGRGMSSSSLPRAGGSHGGYAGGFDLGDGGPYGSIQFPTLAGSGGGSGSGVNNTPPIGGAGGGVAWLNVQNTLLIDGRISANGFPGQFNSGGGSGGSIRIHAKRLAGSGSISADGGDGQGNAGGGSGGRIALYFATNELTGPITAAGGSGIEAGGAGTIFIQRTNAAPAVLLVDNGGRFGRTTPLGFADQMPTNAFDLVVADGAAVQPLIGGIPVLQNLTVESGGSILAGSTPSLQLAVMDKLTVEHNGLISALGQGFAASTGPGAGMSFYHLGITSGAGAGHGGVGGDSATGAQGGNVYGSEIQPVTSGSGGGAGTGPFTGGAGGGTLRISAGSMQIDGELNADGREGLQDNSGGGSGGSIWITTREFSGNGLVTASGGSGELFLGGGGGGGRIAIYARTNSFTGTVAASGGIGASPGESGSIYHATNWTGFAISSFEPSGTWSNYLSEIYVQFNDLLDATSVNVDDLTVIGPGGLIPPANYGFSLNSPSALRLTIPQQIEEGVYQVIVNASISNLFGDSLAATVTNSITVVLPTISGTVLREDGSPAAAHAVYFSGLHALQTDSFGRYSANVPSGWTGTVRPFTSALLISNPHSREYTNLVDDMAAQDFVISLNRPQLIATLGATNLTMHWDGVPGAIYQLEVSTNLINWNGYGFLMGGSNAVVDVPFDPMEPAKFFRLQVLQ